jgi:hypothetical protein
MVPPAPVTFSTSTCWPSVRAMCAATILASTSVAPPGAKTTIMLIWRFGKSCARDGAANSSSAASAPIQRSMAISPVRADTRASCPGRVPG